MKKILLDEFVNDLRTVFGHNFYICICKKKIQVRSKRIFITLKNFGCNKSHKWFIPKEILTAISDVQLSWIRAFIDDEAYIDVVKKEIVINLVNLDALKQIAFILRKLDIFPTIGGPYIKAYRLRITKRESLSKLSKIITPKHPKKINQ